MLEKRWLLFDANVLIEFHKNRCLDLLAELKGKVGRLGVLDPIIAEAMNVPRNEILWSGIELVPHTLEQLKEAKDKCSRKLTKEDWLGIIVSRDGGWICVTGDKKMLRTCRSMSIDTRENR